MCQDKAGVSIKSCAIPLVFIGLFCVAAPFSHAAQREENADMKLLKTWLGSKAQASKAETRFRRLIERDSEARKRFFNYLIRCCAIGYLAAPETEELNSWGAGIVVLLAPQDLLVEAIAPELGRKGRLYGLLHLDKEGRQELVQHLELRNQPNESPSFHYYTVYLKKHADKVPEGLAGHMLSVSPGLGLRTLVRVYLGTVDDFKTVLLTERLVDDLVWKLENGLVVEDTVISNVAKKLSDLSQHPVWWVRLYVVHIMLRYKDQRQTDVLRRLAKDEHPEVREAVAEIGSKF